MKQKLLNLLCALLATISVNAYDFAYDYNGTTLYFNITSDATCEVTRGESKYSGDIVIPSNISCEDATYTITAIGATAFYDCRTLTSIEIPETVTFIASGAFAVCSALTEVNIPNSVTKIGDEAFSNCKSLTTIKIPNSVTTIGQSAFLNCTSLATVEIATSVKSIGAWAFRYCENLTSIKVFNKNPANITLGSTVFDGVPTSSCVLFVPKGSKELYNTANQWRNFKNIEEFDSNATGIETIESGVAACTYYDLSGRKVKNPTSGIYIHNGKKVFKK